MTPNSKCETPYYLLYIPKEASWIYFTVEKLGFRLIDLVSHQNKRVNNELSL